MDNGKRIAEDVEVFLRAARGKDVRKCSEMLKQKPSLIDSIEAGGFSALHFAAFNGDLDMLYMLLEHKPTLDLRNYDGNTPMIMAAKVRQHAAIRLLIEAGADVNCTTPTGGTAAHFAASMGHVDTVRYLVDLGANVMHQDCETGSLLHWAAHSGDVNCIGAIIYEFKIPIDIRDSNGGTPLFTALFMKKVEAVEFLLEHGADPQAVVEGDHSTPLHIAVEHSNTECVRLLLGFGADPNAVNTSGETPVALAEKAKNQAMLKELLKPMLSDEKRKEEALRFKTQGNKVFEDGENVKAAKFYGLAIRMDSKNHIFFSNRAAAYFNQHHYSGAYWDAVRCVTLAPQWPKGYFRKAATELAMKKYEESLKTCEEGLRLDPNNKDLLTTRDEKTRKNAYASGDSFGKRRREMWTQDKQMSLATVGRFLETVDSRDKLLKGASALAKLFLYASGNAAYGQIALSASEARRIIRLLGWLSSVQVLSYLLRKDWGNKHDLLAIARVTGEFVFKLCDNIAFLGAKAGILTNGAVQFSYGSRLGLFFAYVFAVALGCLDLQRFKDNKVARQRHCMVLLQRTCDMLCAASGVRFGGFQMSRVLDASLALLSASISSVANYRDLTARLGG